MDATAMRTDPRLTDPDAARHVASINAGRSGQPSSREVGPAEARRRVLKPRVPDDERAVTRDLDVPAEGLTLRARLYVPRDPRPGVMLFFHGGGWVTGDLEMNDVLCRDLAAQSGTPVLSVDYRLAPEHPFPAPIEDGLAAVSWIAAGGLGASLPSGGAGPLLLAGHSAGGNIAAALAIRLRDLGVGVARQVLLCPILDHDLDTGSYRRFGDGLVLTRSEMEWFWDQYEPDAARRLDPLASPLRSPDLSGLAPAIVVVGGCDPLRDEGVAYAGRLADAGVPAVLIERPGVPHLFLNFPPMPCRDETVARVAEELGA